MSSLTLSRVPAGQARIGAYGLAKRRWIHGSLKRQAILMPAMSPMMTEGTITHWKKKEGEAFSTGDVLLQIESDLYTIDVEAQCPGILGKILMPDGTSNVPVEQVIALVARDVNELTQLLNQTSLPTPLPFNVTPAPPSSSLFSPRPLDQFNFSLNKPLSSPRTPTMSPRTPSLFEMHTMGYGHRSAHVGGPRGGSALPRLDSGSIQVDQDIDVAPCPSPRSRQLNTPLTPSTTVKWPRSQQQPQDLSSLPVTPCTASWPVSAMDGDQETAQTDAAAMRRMIISNLSSPQTNNTEINEFI